MSDEYNKKIEKLKEKKIINRPSQEELIKLYGKEVELIPINEIKIYKRIRGIVNQVKVNNIAESITEVGLINPISISSNRDLLAGLHRLKACEKLGWDVVPCIIITIEDPLKLELIQIDENLIRSDLHFIERGKHLRRRKEIYEMLHPETKDGGDRRSKNFSFRIPETEKQKTFSEDTSEKADISTTIIYEEIKIATDLAPEI